MLSGARGTLLGDSFRKGGLLLVYLALVWYGGQKRACSNQADHRRHPHGQHHGIGRVRYEFGSRHASPTSSRLIRRSRTTRAYSSQILIVVLIANESPPSGQGS